MMTGTVVASEGEGQPALVSFRIPITHWAAMAGLITAVAGLFWRVETKEPEVKIIREVPAEVSQKLDRMEGKIDDVKDRVIRMEIRLDNLPRERRVANVAKDNA